MSRLYNRQVEVTISRGTIDQYLNLGRIDSVTVKDLRVQFSIERNTDKTPDTCSMVITNLSDDSRSLFKQRPLHVRIDAGYDGKLKRLFAGDVQWAQSYKRGTDWETEIQLGDGDRAFRFARINRSYESGVTVGQVVRDIAREMGLTVVVSDGARQFLRKENAQGVSFFASASNNLDTVLKPYRLSWNIVDGKIYIMKPGEYVKIQPILINQSTGMIGTPELGAPSEKGKRPVLSVACLLHPSIPPAAPIHVQSRDIDSVFVTESVRHSGDTHGDRWMTEIEARAPGSGANAWQSSDKLPGAK